MPRLHSKRARHVLLGVMADLRGVGAQRRTRPFGEQSAYFRRLSRIAHEEGVTLFVFSPTDVSWRRRRVLGYVNPARPNGSKRWVRRSFRFPHFVYDRFAPESVRARLLGERAARRFRRAYGIPCFNESIGDKWRVYRRLVRNRRATPYLPATARFVRWSQIPRWLSKYPAVYLKPAFARHGRGIARVRRRRRGGYRVEFHVAGSGQRSFAAPTLHQLARRCRRYMRRRRYLIQQGIPPATRTGQPLSIRAFMLNREDGWRVAGVAARLGRAGAVVDNLHAGGKMADPETVLKEHVEPAAERVESVMRRIHEASVRIASALAGRRRYLTELGIDLLVDGAGKIWFLEANPRPGRTLFRHMGDGTIWDEVNRGPVEYAIRLATRKSTKRAPGQPAAGATTSAPSADLAPTEVNNH